MAVGTERRPPVPAAEATGRAGLLGRLAGVCYERRWRVLAVWVLLIIGANVGAQAAGTRFENNFTAGETPSQRAQDILTARFPSMTGDTADIVFSTTGPVAGTTARAEIGGVVAAVRPLPHVVSVESPFTARFGQIAPDGHIAYAVVQFDTTTSNLPAAAVKRVVSTARDRARPGFDVELGGAPISAVVTAAPGPSEGVGTGAAMLIMLIAFGSVVAMGLPIITALFGLAIGIAVLELLTWLLVIPVFSPEMAAMIGLGVGIDYALFIVTRYRQGLAEGLQPRRAVVRALDTSGRAVLFAGSTVVISLVGLFLVGQPYMIGLATGSIGAVVLVLAAALTLLPAMLGFAGHAIDRLHVPGLFRQPGATARGFWYRWSRTVQRRAWVTGLGSVAVLVVLALPMFSIRLAFTDAGNDPTNLTTRQAYDLLARGFGPGFNGPLVVVTELTPGHGDDAVVERLAGALRTTPGVAFVAPPRFNRAGDAAVTVVDPTTSPQAAATQALVRHLRSAVIAPVVAGTGVVAEVGGETAAGIDAADFLSGRLFVVIGAVIALSFLLLLCVFRSLLIPLKAAVMNLLSLGAAYGVMVAVFEWGWLGGVIGIGHTGPIDPWIPLTMFTILFGLSMDYEVFLVSRIREEWLAGNDNSAAVADGLAVTARVITAAAAIMFCVFASFVVNDPLHILKVFGLGLAVAVLVDATLVRMVLVPSVMELLGRANWWLPGGLEQRLPRFEADPATLGVPAGS